MSLTTSPSRRREYAAVGGDAWRFDASPVQTLLRRRMFLDAVSLNELSARLSIPARTLDRVLRADSLAWTVADRWAVALGYHPCQLWPTWFLHPDAEPAVPES